MKRVLLTSVCRPLGERYGDGPSVGYELLHGQVTRAQGMFSPRATHIHFSLEYIAENLDAPATVLQYPTRRELARELKRGYDVVGVSFLLATFHRMKEAVALIRRHAPSAKIVLGGYGTVLPDDVLKPYGDFICREEGVAFMRRLLDEPELPMPYRHPLVVSRLRVFGIEVSRTGMIFAGLGCPNGCDFCCTSHFFKRRHIRLLPTGRDIYGVIERHLEKDPDLQFVILDEDFLLNRKRALEFHRCVQEGGRPLSIFAFASVKAISQYDVREIAEMGIDGVWIGYEGTRSGYAKQAGRPIERIFREFHEHGISILASMIVGFPYQTPGIIDEEMSGLLALRPTLSQFLIYGPTPGTPFYDRVVAAGSLQPELARNPETYYRRCTGFSAMVTHPTMSPAEIEAAQRRCFEEDFRRLGPSIYRSVESWLAGYIRHRDSDNAMLRAKALVLRAGLRDAIPIFLAGRWLGPSREARRAAADLERRVLAAVGPSTVLGRLKSVAVLGLALWTGLRARLGLFQHPRLIRHAHRMDEGALVRVWRRLRRADRDGHHVKVEMKPEATVWVGVEGRLALAGARRLIRRLRRALKRTRNALVVDFTRLVSLEREAAERFARVLASYRSRIRVMPPACGDFPVLAAFHA